ncbi:MAG: winged helix-turn-helix domain-containing protein [Promethearchaeota archaeon]
MLRIANQIRRKKALDNKYFLYDFIDKNSGLSQYDLSKKIGWSIGKINYYVKKLLQEGMIKNSTEIINGKARKSYYGKSMKEFINWDEMNDL